MTGLTIEKLLRAKKILDQSTLPIDEDILTIDETGRAISIRLMPIPPWVEYLRSRGIGVAEGAWL